MRERKGRNAGKEPIHARKGSMMSCCATEGTDKFFSRQARRFARRFRRRGLDKPSRLIVKGLLSRGIAGKSLLDIGCGVGGLHLTLLQKGASYAQGVELAEGMLNAARLLAEELGFKERVRYQKGDFVSMDGDVAPADVVVLDKVICCYPDFEDLIVKSTGKARSLYAVSYPRDAFFPRLGFRSGALLGKILKWSFSPYYHDPVLIDGAIRGCGLKEVFSEKTFVWKVKVFTREDPQ